MDWYFHLGLVFPFPGIKVDILRGAVTLGPYYPLRFWGKGSGRSAPPTASVRGDSSHSTNASTTVQSSLSPPATASINIYADVTKELKKSEFAGLDMYFKEDKRMTSGLASVSMTR